MAEVSAPVLTWRQGKGFRFIRDYIATHGRPPAIREIGDAVGLASTSSVAWLLTGLERKGYVIRGSGPRSLLVAPAHVTWVTVSRQDLADVLAQIPVAGGGDNGARARLAAAVGPVEGSPA